MLSNLHHVAFVVASVDSAMEFVDGSFGLKAISRNRFEQDGVDLAIYQLGQTFFEITAPIGENSPLKKFLAERGPGIHHVAFGVADIEAGVAELMERGVALADSQPRSGRSGWTVINVDSQQQMGLPLQLVQLGG